MSVSSAGFVRVLVGAVLGATSAYCACARTPSSPDGAVDAAVDGSVDASDDRSEPTDAIDDHEDAGDAGWARLPGLPADCEVDIAANPTAIVSMSWTACDGVAGCSILAGEQRALRGVGSYDGGLGYFWIMKLVSGADLLHIVARTDGRPVALFRAPDNAGPGPDVCMIGGITFSSGQAVFYVRTPSTVGTQHVFEISLDPPSSIRAVDVVTPEERGTSSIQSMAVSGDLVAYDLQPGSRVFAVDDGGRVELPRVGGAPYRPLLVGTHILWSELSDRARVAHRALDGTSEMYFQSAAGDVLFPKTDGSHVIFVLAIPNYATTGPFELWAGNYARTPDAFLPRRVMTLPHHIRPVLGGGHVAYLDESVSPPGITVVDLDTGRLRRYRTPSPYRVADIPLLAISETQVLFRVRSDAVGDSVMTLDLDVAPFEEIVATP